MQIALFSRAGLASLIACGFLTAATPASAQDFIRGFFDLLGVTSSEKDPIEYRERAPLVVPPKHVLRAPDDAAALAERQPRWPVDPDVTARKNKREAARKPDFTLHGDPNPRLSVDEIRAGRIPGAGVPKGPDFGDRFLADKGSQLRLTPDEMRSFGAAAKEPLLAYGEEPQRRYITEPPKGYRVPAAGAPIQATKEHVVKDSLGPSIHQWQQDQIRRN